MFAVHEVKAKHILTKTGIPGADYAINHYSGCQHACIYCYARFVCRWRNSKEKWGEFVDVKINAAELVAEESKNKKGIVFLSSVSDPYQPIERKYQLTRKVLQNLNPEMGLSILTKSDLITKDMDVFSRFKQSDLGLTITTLDSKIKKIFEPNSPTSQERVDALKKLKENGFYTYCFIAPILPFLTDMEEIVKEVSPFVDFLMFDWLNMPAARGQIMDVIKNSFPELEEKYEKLSDEFWLEKRKEIVQLGKKYKKPIKICFGSVGLLKFG